MSSSDNLAAAPVDLPMVSIVLATNRNSPYLPETLRSVQAQSMEDWELLVVDNGVPDPGEVLSLIRGDRRMRMITVAPSETAGTAWNIGVAQTTGEFVTYLADDDVWAPTRLERHLQAHGQRPAAVASYSGYWHMDSEGQHFGEDWRSRAGTSADMLRGAVDTPVGGTVMLTREACSAIGGYSPEIPILVDFEFALRLALRGELIYVDELLLGYRRHSGNMTSTAPDNARKRRRVMEQMIDRQRWAALGRGDEATAELFSERLRLYRKNEARVAGPAVFRALRRRQFYDATEQSAWAVSRAPFTFVKAVSSTPLLKAKRMLQRS